MTASQRSTLFRLAVHDWFYATDCVTGHYKHEPLALATIHALTYIGNENDYQAIRMIANEKGRPAGSQASLLAMRACLPIYVLADAITGRVYSTTVE